MRRRIRLPLLSHNRHPGCATLGLRICHLIDAVLSPDRSMSGLFLGGLRMLVNLTKHPEAFDPETVIILAEVAWPAAPASHIGTFKTEHEAGRLDYPLVCRVHSKPGPMTFPTFRQRFKTICPVDRNG